MVNPHTDGSGQPTAAPGQGNTGQPTAAPPTCVSKWSSWINKDHPDTDAMEREFMQASEIKQFCGDGKLTKIECLTSDGGDIPYYSSGEIGTTCDVQTGLTCLNLNNYPLTCNDYKIRYYCQCTGR